jgi:enoyl-CoA hydratase/carnithine racemase
MTEEAGALVTTSVVGHVAAVEMHRPPSNFFDRELLASLCDHVLALDADPAVRCIVLGSEGRHFCAGADLRGMDEHGIRSVYREALRLFSGRTPIVASVQGAAVGGGLGLAMTADFRVVAEDARLSANFAQLGFHQGFGLSATLPRAVGAQRALELLYTGRPVTGSEAVTLGLADRAVAGDPRAAATAMAEEIASSSPLSLRAIRATMRRQLVAEVAPALDLEALAQSALLDTADFAEGIAASIAKRRPAFHGR